MVYYLPYDKLNLKFLDISSYGYINTTVDNYSFDPFSIGNLFRTESEAQNAISQYIARYFSSGTSSYNVHPDNLEVRQITFNITSQPSYSNHKFITSGRSFSLAMAQLIQSGHRSHGLATVELEQFAIHYFYTKKHSDFSKNYAYFKFLNNTSREDLKSTGISFSEMNNGFFVESEEDVGLVNLLLDNKVKFLYYGKDLQDDIENILSQSSIMSCYYSEFLS